MAKKIKDSEKKSLRLTIKLKLILLTGGFLVLLGIFGILTYYSFKQIIRYDELNANVNNIARLVAQTKICEKDFLARESTNPDFFVTKESVYFNKITESRVQILNVIFGMDSCSICNSIQNFHENTDSISELYTHYIKTLEEAKSLVLARGYKDYGLVGEMRAAIHTVTDAVEELGNCDYSNMALTLRKHEKDYIIRKDKQYIDRFNDLVDKFNQKILQSTLDEATVNNLMHQLDQYKTKFNKLAEVELSIGKDEETGIRGQLNTHYQNMQIKIDETIHTIANKREQKIRLMSIQFVLVIALIALTFTITHHRIGREILKPLKLFKIYFDSLSQGEPPRRK
ncbi:MAG: hypothetical protein HC896_11700 [Bacteroidales bacterium]|nr:hypothetical protein [Bacteroidales bacterium]